MTTKEIGEKIASLRKRKGISKNELASLSGVSPTYIYQIERGDKCPTIEYLGHICWGLGVSLSEFFADEDEKFDRLSFLNEEQRKKLCDFLDSLDN